MDDTRQRPFVIGLTGGIGSGKSNVLSTLVALGAEGIDADRVAHEVMAPGGPAYADIVAEFGPEIVGPDGRIDRGALGGRVFADPAALTRLEAIMHPAVAEVIAAQVAASRAPVVVIEAIKLFESGLGLRLCDQVWVTVCSEADQIARLAASRHMPEAEVRRRLANQMSTAHMLARADRVIDTRGSVAETRRKVQAAWIALGLPVKDEGRSTGPQGVRQLAFGREKHD